MMSPQSSQLINLSAPRTATPPQASVPRCSYLILFRDKVRQHFRRTALDGDEDPAWFEHRGTPLKWCGGGVAPAILHMRQECPRWCPVRCAWPPRCRALARHRPLPGAPGASQPSRSPRRRICRRRCCRAGTLLQSSSTSSRGSRKPTTSRQAAHTPVPADAPQHMRPTVDGLAADTDRHQLWLGLFRGAGRLMAAPVTPRRRLLELPAPEPPPHDMLRRRASL